MQEQVNELFRLLRSSQERYIYFLLASVGAAIAFSLNQTSQATISLTQIPLALSLSCWAASFFFGCRHIQQVNSITYSNIELLRIEGGQNPILGNNITAIRELSVEFRRKLEECVETASKYADRQLFLFYSGVISYIGWHVIAMIGRTNF